jgi:LmbE family N-acetylglucosaminyl deacetylase
MQRTPAFDAVRSLGSLLTVWAHPDDESYLAGGLMAIARRVGSPVTCVTATLGERGGPVDQHAETAWRRREELADALLELGVTDSIALGHADGHCATMSPRGPVQTILRLLRERRPDTIVTFGRDGLTGHPDHQAVSMWVSAAVLLDGGPRPRVLHVTESIEHAAGFPAIDGVYEPGFPQRHPADELAVTLELPDDVLDRKIAALRSHRSQTTGLEQLMGADTYRRWCAVESFVDAPSPLGRPGRRAITNLPTLEVAAA